VTLDGFGTSVESDVDNAGYSKRRVNRSVVTGDVDAEGAPLVEALLTEGR
jgi:hypothetical protein